VIPPFPSRVALVAASILAILMAVASPAAAQNYPRIALYGQMYSTGAPLWDVNGVLDPLMLDAIARYDELVIEASPITEYRPDALQAIRQRHPGISLLAYVAPSVFYFGLTSDSLSNYPSRLIRTVRNLDGFLYDRGGGYFSYDNINLAKRDRFGRYVVAESLAVLWNDAVVKAGVWDGIFVDVFCDGIGWMESPAESIDVQRAGYTDFATFDAAWKAGSDVLADRLRALAGGSIVLVGNCAMGTKYASFNGWMRENFPYQGGGTWYTNLFNQPGGYLWDESHFRAPTHDYVLSNDAGVPDPYHPMNTRKVRFGLASAALAGGYGAFGPISRQTRPVNYLGWWYDEYAVDVASGAAATDLAHTGWLGLPLGPASQMIWTQNSPDAVTNSDFETGVTEGWTFSSTTGATLTQDVTTSAVGAASAHLRIPANGTVPWTTAMASTGTLALAARVVHSATFWARADRVRDIRVVAATTTSGEFIEQRLALGTGWRQYQVALVPAAAGNSRLAFYLGESAGDVWFDDCHFQSGASTVFRRDFQNGIVLVNPSDAAMTVPLERSFRRIAGRADPLINDGQVVTQTTIAPSDAIFLIGSDITPPAAVTDLRRVP
jgi:hypothetical protein